jgi:hypothetical protein
VTGEEIRARLRAEVERAGSVRRLANELACRAHYISKILCGGTSGTALMERLGAIPRRGEPDGDEPSPSAEERARHRRIAAEIREQGLALGRRDTRLRGRVMIQPSRRPPTIRGEIRGAYERERRLGIHG